MNEMPVVANVSTVLLAHVQATIARHGSWPNDAVYCVEYSIKAWPTGYSYHTKYFSTIEELKSWYESHREWATYEGNYFTVDNAFEWDLGPNQISLFELFNSEGSTY